MYGSSGKMGRGAGGSAVKRNIHAPPINRRAPSGLLSMGGGTRGPGVASSASTSSPSASSLHVDESFNLVRENPLSFGMAIKLAPDLVGEIKRGEEQGGTARIKFDVNSNNPNGNVIQVGDKIFRFTWSREPGDLCAIYEECQGGEDGNGLFIESGGTWRKLNVERELDESTKNHVKMRSEEAERKLKSQKVQVLDPSKPSMKNQMSDLVDAESNNTRRNFKPRKEPPYKKPKSEPPSGGAPKSIFKFGMPTTLTKSKISLASPMSSQLDQSGGPASPLESNNFVKGLTNAPDVGVTQNIDKTSSTNKEMRSMLIGSSIHEEFKHNQNKEGKPADLRSLMISLLQENQHKGMNLKALEKAVGDALPNSVRQIEPILKRIATFQAPGKYFMKPGVELDSSKKPMPLSGSSPEANRTQSPVPQKRDQLPAALDSSLQPRTSATDEGYDLNSAPVHTTDMESIDILNNSSSRFSNKKVSDNSDGLVGSSSDSGSDTDSDSDSSNSGSDSGSQSRSKSRSPVGSRSGSSSDSESDASSSSKQASDEDVDIMTSDDEKEPKHKVQHSDPSLKSPVILSHTDDESVDMENDEKQDDHTHNSDVDVVDFPKNYCEDDHHAERSGTLYPFPNEEGEVPIEDFRLVPADNGEERQLCDRKASDGPDSMVSDGFKQGQSFAQEGLSKYKSKRHIEDKHTDRGAHSRKKLKNKNTRQPVSGTISSIFGESPESSSPDRPLEGSDEGLFNQMMPWKVRDDIDDHNFQTGVKHIIPARSVFDYPQPRQFESHAGNDPPRGENRPSKHYPSDHGVTQTSEGFRSLKGFDAEAQAEDGLVSERRPMNFHAGDDKHGTMAKSRYRKPEQLRKPKEAVAHCNSNPYMEYSQDSNTINTGRTPSINSWAGGLQREHSDLELGEFREPLHDVAPGLIKKAEVKCYNKQLKSRQMDSEYWNSDFSRGKPSIKVSSDLGKSSSPNSEELVAGIVDGSSKRKSLENYADDRTKSEQTIQRMHQYNQSQGNHTEVSSTNNKVPEINSKNRSVEAGSSQVGSLDAPGDASRKVSIHPSEQSHNSARGNWTHVAKENKKQKPNAVNVPNGRRKDTFMAGRHVSSQKSNKSSSYEIESSYTKYEKEEPELKGSIKDAGQYRQYVEEYQEKYESYCSLDKILKSYRHEFRKYAKNLESCQGKDMKRYNDLSEQIRSSFCQCRERHNRLTKIFVVIHEELKHLKQMMREYATSLKESIL